MVSHRIALACAGLGMSASILNAQIGRGVGGPIGRGQNASNQAALQLPTRSTLVASYDERTNSVLLSGPSEDVEKVEKLIAKLDANPVKGSETYFYRLRNGSALNIEAVANMLFNGTNGSGRASASSGSQLNNNRVGATQLGGGSGRGAGTRGGGGLTTGGLTTAATGRGTAGAATFGSVASGSTGMTGQVSIVADPATNSLLVTTSPSNWLEVKRVLDELDRSLAQVLIKVLIAEVSHTNGSDLGADLSFFDIRLGTNISSGTASTGVLGSTGKTSFGVPGTGGFLTINEDNVSATLHALQTQGKIDVLSRPYILASDNQLASITVGQTVPYIASSQITNVGNTINTPNYANVGVLLDVVPHINPDGMVIMDVSPEISSVADSTVEIATGLTLPVFNTRSAETHIALKDGQTAVIGGLMQDQVNSTINKVPLLGDIPFIGMAFQRKEESKTKTELLIFMTPHVVTRPEDLQGMGESELKTTKLVPTAVSPGAFQEHQKGLDAGQAPNIQPNDDTRIEPPTPDRSELPEEKQDNQDE